MDDNTPLAEPPDDLIELMADLERKSQGEDRPTYSIGRIRTRAFKKRWHMWLCDLPFVGGFFLEIFKPVTQDTLCIKIDGVPVAEHAVHLKELAERFDAIREAVGDPKLWPMLMDTVEDDEQDGS